MSKRKKMIIGALILTLAVAVGIGATTVCGPKGSWARGFPPGFHGMGCHPGTHGENGMFLLEQRNHQEGQNHQQAGPDEQLDPQGSTAARGGCSG